jgi:SAM-dependent methyltransferase
MIEQTLNRLMVSCVLILMVSSCAQAQVEDIERDVPFVPTPQPVVEEMLRLADPKEGEVLYDLGCGDGRIVVTAAKKYKVRGIGVDIDPERIRESNENAEKAGVSERVKFIRKNLFEMDFGDADVLCMYLLPSVNVKLRPKILEDMRPGARVVSHSFDMGDWSPDKTVQVAESNNRTLYFWVVPAQIEQMSQVTLETPEGKQQATLNLTQSYQNVSGTAKIGEKEIEITDGKLTGDRLSFTVDGQTYTCQVAAKNRKKKAA